MMAILTLKDFGCLFGNQAEFMPMYRKNFLKR